MAGKRRKSTEQQTLTDALQPVVRELVEDMRARLVADTSKTAEWKATHAALKESQRTGATWADWQEDQLTQAAVGWVLTSVFVRFCEDNDLLGSHQRWISGADADGRRRAVDEQDRFFSANLDKGFRGYLRHAFAQLKRSPAAAPLVGEHAGIHIAEPSDDAAQWLVEFWRQADAQNATMWSLRDPSLDTRFLGDMYQDLSEYAKKKYALLQTPEFVEEFILDRTLTPALKERSPRFPTIDAEGRTGAVDFKVIDPTCGSGHFLLGAFRRMLDHWRAEAPGVEQTEQVRLALSSIHGVDINPFAVAIAQFRLMVAALQATGGTSLLNVPALPLQVYAGDSLLWSEDTKSRTGLSLGDDFDPDKLTSGLALTTEDEESLKSVLRRGQYDVVVGNPPYITVKDKALNIRYREIYGYCKGTYALTVPFMEQFHALARPGRLDSAEAGWIGQITSNSFMAREFGVPLIEEFFERIDLREVIDTSGAYIPGHGTPTVTIISRNRPIEIKTRRDKRKVRAVLGIQGEPGAPEDPAQGLVWRSIVEHIEIPEYEDQWISVVDLPRDMLSVHPWSLQGGAATTVSQQLKTAPAKLVSKLGRPIGFASFPGADDAFFAPRSALRAALVDDRFVRGLIVGEVVREWNIRPEQFAFTPYNDNFELVALDRSSSWYRWSWRNRRVLQGVTGFEGETRSSDEDGWWGWYRWVAERYRTRLSITFAEVATHNHFVLDRGGKVFKQTAPVIKLPEVASEDEHLELLGVLNSSTACFWLKQNCHNKGSTVDDQGARTTLSPWENFYQFNSSNVKNFPLPAGSALERARHIDQLAQELAAVEPAALLEEDSSPSAELFARGEAEWERIRGLMIAEQEELDWRVYHLYGFTETDLSLPVGEVPGLALGERAFEIALARRVQDGEAETAWFDRHRSTPVTEIPAHLPAAYRDAVQRRLDLIAEDRSLELLERPEYKRRWSSVRWADRVRSALAAWVLDRLETPELWKDPNGYPQSQSVRQLAARVETDPRLTGVAEALELWSTKRQAGTLINLVALLADEAVPYLAALRLKDPGLRRFAEWQVTWDAQRAEDRGEITTAEVPVPPKYTSADFRKASYWQARGKLDVPKERFIAYPGASGPDDPTAMLGWAGWDHAEQGIALVSLYDDRKDDTDPAQLTPLVAGLAELQPWIRQWHSGMDAHSGIDWADYLSGQLTTLAERSGIAIADLPAWRPAPATRGRKRVAAAAPTPDTES